MIYRSMAREKMNVVPMSADDKPLELQKLQGSIHFEKTLPAATAASYHKKFAGLTIPSWFVQKHRDKFGKSTILRSEASTEPWPVNLNIWHHSPTMTQVRFAGGWKAFAVSNGLLEGDLLIFVLMAMSEFKVYVFRSTGGRNKNPTPKRRRSTCDSDRSQKKAKRPYRKCRDARLSTDEERSDEGNNGSKRKSSVVYDSAIPPTPPSCKEISSHHLPSFEKTLTATNVSRNVGASLEFPEDFWRTYGTRIHSAVKLQGIHEQSPVRTMTCHTSPGQQNRHFLRAEWRAFVTENCLQVGQQLLFTLSGDSFFVVRDQSAISACSWV